MAAYIFNIKPTSGAADDTSVHQTSPHWVLSFVRWEQRDTLRTDPRGGTNDDDGETEETHDWTSTRGSHPLVVENDCIQCSVNVNKGNLTHSMTAVLVMTDVNYATQIAPGDFCVVNMLNWSRDARRVADNARKGTVSLNNFEDGFKGLFKIQSVRKTLQLDPNSGEKIYVFKITGYAFTEFNNVIYFNPEMLTEADKTSISMYVANIGTNWANITADKALTNAQNVISVLIQSFIGNGIGPDGKTDGKGNMKSPNTLFYIPKMVGILMGMPGATAAKDIYNYLFGIQEYSELQNTGAAVGFNPSNLLDKQVAEPTDPELKSPEEKPSGKVGRFYYTTHRVRGEAVIKPEYWNQIKVWSILNQFANSPLNELFTTFRVSPQGRVMPTVVLRQIPFSTPDFKSGGVHVTHFDNLPRWKAHPTLVLGYDLGRDEAARINFVQMFGRATLTDGGFGTSEEIARRNYLIDIDDVKRNGLRPYVVSTTFDLTKEDSKIETPGWARILGDALIGGHLKLSGTVELVGIVEPIAVGDNFEFDGTIYHIEEVAHSCTYSKEGRRMFRTRLSLSNGIAVTSSTERLLYSEMAFGSAKQKREADWVNGGMLPGISESQSTVYRPDDVDSPVSSSSGYEQPNHSTRIGASSRTDGNGSGGGDPGKVE